MNPAAREGSDPIFPFCAFLWPDLVLFRGYTNMLKLTGGEVHVWPLHLTAPDSITRTFESMLAPEERNRAARYHFDHLRPPFILSHGALRILLGRQLGIEPGQVQLKYGARGKPSLDDPAHRVTFNMSHSGECALFALTLDCDVGVDVERIRPVRDMAAIANRFFCPEEAAELMSLEFEDRARAFFHCWTRKEAYIKAIGEGLSVPLDSFRVTFLPGSPVQFHYIRHEGAIAANWKLHNLQFLPDYAGALAYPGPSRAIRLFRPVTAAELLDTC
jgi:4'-phosphopantetheinyl transferase